MKELGVYHDNSRDYILQLMEITPTAVNVGRYAKIVQEKTGGAHAAVVTAVAKAAFNSAVDAVRAGGRVVAVGLPPESMSLDIPRLVLDGIEVVGSLVGTRQDLTEAFQFAAEGKVVPKVALRPLADINTIFTEMEEGKIRGRMVIDFRH